MKRAVRSLSALIFSLFGTALLGQTDETIFREFQFDFSTPGARANGMGRAFVGLSDEATAAYNNPAGLSALLTPEFSFEYRVSHSRFEALQEQGRFVLLDGSSEPSTFDLSSLTFASFSTSFAGYNFSAFYVNHLDYRRNLIDENLLWEFDDDDSFPTFIVKNEHDVGRITLDTYGTGISRRFGPFSIGASVGFSRLDINYKYFTNLASADNLPLFDLVRSRANQESTKPTYVLGAMYQVNPKLKLALSLKKQPRFSYQEIIQNNEFQGETPVTVQFKIPDAYQFGLAYQPDDFWTLVFDLDWVQYRQLSGANFTVLSANEISRGNFFKFRNEDFTNGNDPSFHIGGEYLLHRQRHIFAFRFGLFTDPDHKTRFVGQPREGEDPRLYEIQDFLYNTGPQKTTLGKTIGIGYVFNNRLQLDTAVVNSNRFRWMVTSFLYRF